MTDDESLPFMKLVNNEASFYVTSTPLPFKNLLKLLKCFFLLKHEAWTRHIKLFVP